MSLRFFNRTDNKIYFQFEKMFNFFRGENVTVTLESDFTDCIDFNKSTCISNKMSNF